MIYYTRFERRFATNHHIWPVGQAVKTPPFHGGNMGSSPVRVTSKKHTIIGVLFCCMCPVREWRRTHRVRARSNKVATTLSEGPLLRVSEIPVRVFFAVYRIKIEYLQTLLICLESLMFTGFLLTL